MKTLSKLTAVLALAAGMAAPAGSAFADPNCDCYWIATGYNMDTGEFTYALYCPTTPTCVATVNPGDGDGG